MNKVFYCLIAAVVMLVSTPRAEAELIYGIASPVPLGGGGFLPQLLYTIDSETLAVTSSVTLSGNVSLRSIDVRPATNTLYGIGNLDNQLYTINPVDGFATALGAPLPVSGAIDFNPVADAIRLIARTGNTNYRVNANTGAVIMLDGQPTYDPGDANEGATTDIRAIGYTNSVVSPASTVLYDIDVAADVLATQTPANGGNLQTVGPIGVNLSNGFLGSGFVGFDISGQTNTAFLTNALPNGTSSLYTVDLTTGTASLQGAITGLIGQGVIADIAVVGGAPVPEPASIALLGLATIGGMMVVRNRRK